MTMQLGLGAIGFGPKATIDIKRMQHAESLGFHCAWTAEAYGNDAVSTAAWVLAQTRTLKVGTAIMQMPARSPAMTAMTAMTLDHLSGGRFILGLGPSGPQVVEGWHGVAYGKPLQRTREYISIVRKVLAREAPLTHAGAHYQIPFTGAGATGLGKPLKSILHGNPAIPIYTASISPNGLRCAGEVADGVFPMMMDPENAEQSYLQFIREGLAKRGDGKTLADFAILPGVTVVVGDDLERARGPIKMHMALYIGGMGARGKNFYNDLAKRLGYEEAAVKIQDLYLGGNKAEAVAAVPDELVDAVHLVGPAARIRERLQAWKAAHEAGAVSGMNIGTSQPEALQLVAEELL